MYCQKIHISALVVVFVLLYSSVYSQELTLQDHYNKAKEAYQQKNFEVFYDHISKAAEMHPYHQGIMYQKALAAAHLQKPEEAVKLLHAAILINTAFDLHVDDFKTLHEREDFRAVVKLKEELKKPVTTSATAFVIRDPQLHAEGIAPGIKSATFFITSIHKRKVIYVDETGKAADFIEQGQDGLGAAMNVKVDKRTNSLWVASTTTPEMIDYDSSITSALYQFDLRTKKLINKFEANNEAGKFFFGDVILTKAREVFVSDSRNNIIFKVNTKTKTLDSFFTSDQFWNIQGISFSADEKYLYIADYIKGIFRLNTISKELQLLPVDDAVSAKGIDGLIYYNNTLITIQNGVEPMRTMKLILNTEGDAIVSAHIIDQAHPAFGEPTNGCLENGTLYYIANSQWGGYDGQKKIKPVSELKDILILKASLD